MTRKNKLKLLQIKSKNKRIKSSFIHLYEINKERNMALATFTVSSFTDKRKQILFVKEIKNYFTRLLKNSSIDVHYWASIELGKNLNNPHTHIQLYFEEENIDKINKAYKKTIDHFNLDVKRCKLVQEDKGLKTNSSSNYVIKEWDNKLMTDKQILALDKARSSLKKGEAKNIQMFSKSRASKPHPLYKKLYYSHQLTYHNVNYLFEKGFAVRLQGMALLNARQNGKLPYIMFKNGAIKTHTIKFYSLIRFFLCLTVVIKSKFLQKCIYINKSNIKLNFRVKKVRFARME
jgi:hypothetical protein